MLTPGFSRRGGGGESHGDRGRLHRRHIRDVRRDRGVVGRGGVVEPDLALLRIDLILASSGQILLELLPVVVVLLGYTQRLFVARGSTNRTL